MIIQQSGNCQGVKNGPFCPQLIANIARRRAGRQGRCLKFECVDTAQGGAKGIRQSFTNFRFRIE